VGSSREDDNDGTTPVASSDRDRTLGGDLSEGIGFGFFFGGAAAVVHR
jgi:hypothetical protein